MIVPVLKKKAMAKQSGGTNTSSGPNINQGYPMIDWSNVPAPTMPQPCSSQQIRWRANYQIQQRLRQDYESENDPNNAMLQNCNQFFSSWREMPPPAELNGSVNNRDQRYQNFPVDQYPINYSRPTTPPMPIPVTEMFSPNTVNEVRSTIRALFPNGPPRPPSVIPVKRNKNRYTPYIVGCTERPRVPERKTLGVFKGGNYGITDEASSSDDEEYPAKRKYGKRNQYPSSSKSSFNANSKEIAATLRTNQDVLLSPQSPDNDVALDMSTPHTSRPQSFSPIPSTSNDERTIMKNDLNFRESLKYEKSNAYDDDDDVDDDDLPDLPWESNNMNNNQNTSESRDIEPIFNTETESQNNNNNSSCDEMDLCEIRFDKYMPIKKFPVPTEVAKDPVIVDEIDLVNVKETEESVTEESVTEVIETSEVYDDYNSITDDDLYSVPKATEPVDVDDLLKELNHFQQKKKPMNHAIITIVDMDKFMECNNQNAPAETATTDINSHHQQPSSSLALGDPANLEGTNMANRESTTEANPATIETGDVIEIPSSSAIGTADVIEIHTAQAGPSARGSADVIEIATAEAGPSARGTVDVIEIPDQQPSTSGVQFVSQGPVGQDHSHSDNSISDIDDELFDNMVGGLQAFMRIRRSRGCRNDRVTSRNLRARKPRATPRRQPPNNTERPENNENAEPSENTPANSANGIGDCPICMDHLTRGSIASTTCGHVFCITCIKKWLRTSGKKCPTCRKTLKGVGYHQIFL